MIEDVNNQNVIDFKKVEKLKIWMNYKDDQKLQQL